MRNRHAAPGGSYGGDTLSRLNDALSILENRIGLEQGTRRNAVPGRDARDDISAIRARQDALENSARAENRMREEGRLREETRMREESRIRDEMNNLRAEMERRMGGSVSEQFDALRSELRQMATSAAPSGNGEAAQMRAEIAELKREVMRMAREDTIQELIERWGVVEREMAALPQTLANRDDLMVMAERLDSIQDAMSHMPRSDKLDMLEDQLRVLAQSVEHLAAQDREPSYAALDALEARLDEISRAVSAIPASIGAGPGVDAFDRIEARIASLADMMGSRDAGFDMQAGMDEIAGRLDTVSSLVQSFGENRSTGTDSAAVEELHRRLDAIAEVLTEQASTEAPDVSGLFARIDDRMAELAERIAANEMGSRDVPSIGALEARLEDIASMLSGGPVVSGAPADLSALEAQVGRIAEMLGDRAPGADVDTSAIVDTVRSSIHEAMTHFGDAGDAMAGASALANLENQIASISERLSAPSAAAAGLDETSVLSAARAAADEAIARMSASGGDTGSLLALGDDLKALEELARESDTRNSRTFEAIHDTLLKVVDHLAGLEDSLRNSPAPAPASAPVMASEPMPAPREPAARRMAVSDAPTIAAEDPADYEVEDAAADIPQDIFATRTASRSPAQAAADAALAALNSEKKGGRLATKPKEAGEKTESKSLFKSVAARFRKEKAEAPAAAKRGDGPASFDLDAMDEEDVVSSDMIELDEEPIEPGTGGSELADIMKRVREQRSFSNDLTKRGGAEEDTSKSDFIAAARRAAQAAAADATAAKSTEDGKGKKAGSLGQLLASRRKPILIGAGAILLALLSLPLLKGFLGGGDQVAMAPEPAAITEEVAPADPANEEFMVLDEAPVDSADDAMAVAEEISPDNVSNEDFQVDASVTEDEEAAMTVRDVAAAETATPVDAPVATPVAATEIPDAVGTVALREAAAAGDAKAMYVVGDFYTGGVPGQSGADLAKAFEWYQKAADLGFAPAQYRVGNFYEKGFGVERDLEAARTWYQMAAEQGNASAMHNLAVLFASGINGTPDMESATRWFAKAAELGVKDSQFNLGILSAKGEGVAQDLAESYKWFAIAAKAGDTDAAAKRDEVAAALRPDQLETARGATELWKAKSPDETANFVAVPEEWQPDVSQTASAPELSAADMRKAVSNIQAILNNSGYDAGPVDGLMGAKTRDAIRKFQTDNGMPATGDVDPALVSKLLEKAKPKS